MTTDIVRPATLVEVLRAHAAARSAQVAYTFLVDGEDEEQRITYGELDRKARLFALELMKHAGRGDRAILLYPSGLEFIVAFLGCLYAGVVAVPANVPHLKRDAPRLKLILQDAQPLVACAPAGFQEKAEALSDKYPEFERLQWMSHEQIRFDASLHGALPEVRGDDLAFLQYTSGSTSAPRGVMLTHSNLLYSVVDCESETHRGEAFRMVSWLPIFHDMGLIYAVLTPLYTGGECILMSPVAFLEKPYRWLRAVTKHHGTHVAAPNFAYDLCATHITAEQSQSLDLAGLVSAVNGAEPVRLGTMQAFAAAFEPCGFQFERFGPSYGLAESTVKVTNRRLSEPFSVASLDPEGVQKDRVLFLADDDPKAYHSVGCGWSHIGADIRIVHPGSRTECGADEIGELWVSSKAVGKGYWNRPEETRRTFGAYLADDVTGPFLRTGDLGFVYKGQLHVVGRIKDMLIVNGRNYHPQDIELTVEQAHPGLRPSCGAAFAVDDAGTERLVVVQEVRREFRKSTEFEAMSNAIRMAIAREHGLRADALVLIMPSRIPKTTSGKIQRHATRDEYLRRALEPLYEWHAPRARI